MRNFFWFYSGEIAKAAIATVAVLFTTLVVLLAPPINRVTTESVVEVLVRDKNGKPSGHGSGVHIGNGWYLTAAHVADGAAKLAIKHQNGTIVEVNGVKMDTNRDVALLYIGGDVDYIPHATPFCDYNLGVGEAIYPKGYPMNLGLVETQGKIVGKASEWGPWANVYRVDAALGPGMSGGPAFDDSGYLIGINVGVALMPVGFSVSTFGVNTIVPITEVCAFIEELKK